MRLLDLWGQTTELPWYPLYIYIYIPQLILVFLQNSVVARTPSISAIIVFFIQFLMVSMVISAPSDITIDKQALLALQARIIPNPTNPLASNWSEYTSVCKWYGVTCGKIHRRVIALNISYMNYRHHLSSTWKSVFPQITSHPKQ